MTQTVQPHLGDAPLITVAQTIATHHVHAVVVAGITKDDTGGDQLVWGLDSDMDIVRAAESEHHSSHLVVTSDGHPVGVLSGLDIAGALAWGRA